MSVQYQCPNCSAPVSPADANCAVCNASFAEGSAWKPVTKLELEFPPVTAMNLAFTALGVALLVATFFPIGSRLLQAATGGMYGPVFKPFSPAVYVLLSYIANYVPLAALAWVLFRQFKIVDRVPYKYRGGKLFGVSVGLILFYLAARVLAATVPGGGAGFAVASLSPIILYPALALLIVAVIRLSIGYGKGTRGGKFRESREDAA